MSQAGQKKKQYSVSQLKDAIEVVRRGALTVTQASKEYKVPYQTLKRWVDTKDKIPGNSKSRERQLSLEEEMTVVEYCQYLVSRNMPLKRGDIRRNIQELVRSRGKATKFNLDKGPSDEWFRGFFQRHPELKESRRNWRDQARACMLDETVIDQHFDRYELLIQRLDLQNKPSQIFCANDSGFGGTDSINTQKVLGTGGTDSINTQKVLDTGGTDSINTQKVLGTGGTDAMNTQNVLGTDGNTTAQDERYSLEHVAVNMCVSADGKVLPSLVIFEENSPVMSSELDVSKSQFYVSSPNGGMNSELYVRWFEQIFLPNCGEARPVLLIMDDLDSRDKVQLIELAEKNEVTIFGLPPHTAGIFHPLDVGIFGPMRSKFRGLTGSEPVGNEDSDKKEKVAQTWQSCVQQVCTKRLVQDSFKRCGLFPFDPSAIDRDRLFKEQQPKREICNNSLSQNDFNVAPSPTGEQRLSPENRRVSTEPADTMASPVNKRKIVKEEEEEKGKKEESKKAKFDEFCVMERKHNSHCTNSVAKEECLTGNEIIRQVQSLSDEESNSDENDKCGVCLMEEPPDEKLPRRGGIKWLACDKCGRWFHLVCVGLKKLPAQNNTFSCLSCSQPQKLPNPLFTVNSVAEGERSTSFNVIPVVRDGRCLFRSIVTYLDSKLQNADRGEQGQILDTILSICETSSADAMRHTMVQHMCSNTNDYKNLCRNPTDVARGIHYKVIEERIKSMSDFSTMPGEVELHALARTLKKCIYVHRGPREYTYGDPSHDIVHVKHTCIGAADVGHYECIIEKEIKSGEGEGEK